MEWAAGHSPPRMENVRVHRWRFCVALFATILLQRAEGQGSAIQRYAVDWSVVPVTAPTSRNLTATCNCDLQTVGCSFGCCCDSKCSSSLTNIFESEDICLPSGTEQQTLKFCVPDGFVFKVNLPASSDFYVRPVEQADSTKFLAQLLCIVSDKNPNIGETYPDPPAGNVGDNAKLAQCPAVISPPATPVTYSFQSVVQAYAAGSSGKQPLTIPYPALSSQCNDQFAVGYLIPTPTGNRDYFSVCERDLRTLNLSVACNGSGLLTPQYYSDIRVLSGQSSTSTIPMTVISVQYLDPVSGALSKANTTTSKYNATTGLCSNIIRYVNMTFYYSFLDAAGYIDKVELSLVLTDILSSSTPLLQSVRVNWLDYAAATSIQFVNSGNPGYNTGFPVLAGNLVTDSSGTSSAIQRLVQGMPVPKPGPNGQCNATSFAYINYGANFTSSCSYNLTAVQLEDFCINQANQPEKYLRMAMPTLLPYFENSTFYFGEWGNSAFNNTNDWIQVSVSGVPFNATTPIYTPSALACSGLVTGFDLQIVTGVAFSSNNLQQKVLYAKICFRTGVWDFPDQLPITTPVRFYLTFNVTFIRLPQQAVTVKKPAPPLVLPLPADIFYPFVITDSAAVACRLSGGLGVFAMAVVLFVLKHW